MDRAKEDKLAKQLKHPEENEKESESIERIIDNTIRRGHNVYLMTDWHLWVRKEKNKPECHKRNGFYKLIKTINDTLDKNDLLIYLGDLVDGEFENKKELEIVLKTIAGKKILVRGNNDLFSLPFYEKCGFSKVVDSFIWHNIIFSHIPLKNDNDLNIHGHLHGCKIYWVPYKNHVDVGALGGRVKPIKLKQVIKAQPEYAKTIEEDKSHFNEGYIPIINSSNIFEECMNRTISFIPDPFDD